MRRCLALGLALATSVDGFLPAVRNVGRGKVVVTRMVLDFVIFVQLLRCEEYARPAVGRNNTIG